MLALKDAPHSHSGKFTDDTLAEPRPNHRKVQKEHVPLGPLDLDPLKVSIARLTAEELRAMNRLDLIEVVRLSGAFSTGEWAHQAEDLDQEGLDRLVFLARGRCRYEVIAVYRRWGRQVPSRLDL